MPSRPSNRSANQSKVTVFEAVIPGLFGKLVARFRGTHEQGASGAAAESRRRIRNGTEGKLPFTHNFSADLLEQFHLPVIDHPHDATGNDTGTATDVTDDARASRSEVAEAVPRETNLTANTVVLLHASNDSLLSNTTLVGQNLLKKADTMVFLNSKTPAPTVVVVPQQSLTATPMQMRCPHCGHEIMTHTKKTVGLCTYIMVGVCCFFCLPCFWVPFVVDAWKDTTHTCPNCNITLGERRML
ncbi:hypothetical protein HPB50_001249 [Hyalomma asiaticum]|uniref:Uncharacterized protein n=1 Tax=Hyalomma asiaticum TaxID=266040 RepID=A0ACB7S0U8_HYAAI|nr:hypothetical protein HPB50_001249 [Hyalomma asiaticum]